MEILDRIVEDTCGKKVKALRMSYVPRDMERCRNGCPNSPDCEDYIPIRNMHVRYAHLNLYVERKYGEH